MTRKPSIESRFAGDDVVAVVGTLRRDPPGQTGAEKKKMLNLLGQESCPPGLLMWAALCGCLELRQKVAANASAGEAVREALMQDAEAAPWYVFDVLDNEDVFSAFVRDIYGGDCPYDDVSTIEELISESMTSAAVEQWGKSVPKEGSCEHMQAELVRILWRFARTMNYGVAYSLGYDDQMFIVLNTAVDGIRGITPFSRNVLRAFLRWSQIRQRSKAGLVPSHGYERYDPVNLVVDVYLRRSADAVPFSKVGIYEEI